MDHPDRPCAIAPRAIAIVDARGGASAALDAVRAAAAGGDTVLVLTGSAAAAAPFVAAGAAGFLATDDDAATVAARLAQPGVERRAASAIDGEEGRMLRAWLDRRIAAGGACAVVAVTLSRLDLVNAAHGRERVDAAIALAGERIAVAAGPDAAVARIAGDHFLIGLGDAATIGLAAIGVALARPFAVAGGPILIGHRIGVADRNDGEDADTLLRRADDALAQARISAGATVRVAAPEEAGSLDALAADLHHAVIGDGIEILFQPQVEIASGRITGVEALARWQHPRLGPLGADVLFAAADRADLGLALSDHIQELTLRTAASWPRSLAPLRLSLNVTAADLARPGFACLFLARVDAAGFPRGRLTVEVTETGMILELDRAATVLAELRGAGCRVAIDDFGTGYSSLAYLTALPLDYLKIDKALVTGIVANPRDRVVVRGVIDIARALGLKVIAEGVETPEQLALLTGGGCGCYQGFLRAGAVDVATLIAMVEDER
jgi:EAL domain-containing protein (putative c-di-GMP-specific phosphodiesterase class I)/GGDEF domain-containing protein